MKKIFNTKNRSNSKKHTFILFTSVLAAGCLLLTGCGSSGNTVQPAGDTDTKAAAVLTDTTGNASTVIETASVGLRNIITVKSSEKVTVTPDIAEVVYGVRTEQTDAAACQEKNAQDVNGVIELLKGLGVSEASIQTSDYSMYPIYNYSNNTQRITGYEATTVLTVSSLPIDTLGDILAQSVKAGINNIQSITYLSSKYDESYSQALKLAVDTAHAKAQVLAEAGGCTLGGVVGITEDSNYSQARYTDNALTSKMSASEQLQTEMADGTGADIMPGELAVEVAITVSYQIR